MTVDILSYQRKIPIDTHRLRRHALWALETVEKSSEHITIVLVNDRRMRALNTAYRGIPKTTDVLSFEYGPSIPGSSSTALGDIVISLPRALRQSRQLHISFEDELTNLVIHGLCHLLGYDHERDSRSAREMRDLEDKMARGIIKREGSSASQRKISGKISLEDS